MSAEKIKIVILVFAALLFILTMFLVVLSCNVHTRKNYYTARIGAIIGIISTIFAILFRYSLE